MRIYYKRLLFAAGLSVFISTGGISAMASGVVKSGPGYVAETNTQAKTEAESLHQQQEEPSIASRLQAAENCNKFILVVGQGGANAAVSYHEKNEEGIWHEIFVTEGRYGRNGASIDKVEGDGKTPVGIYRFTSAFGILDDPGSILPYKKLTKYDYWVDDSNSAYYNRMVDTRQVKKDWTSAEIMSASVPYYNYGIALDHNVNQIPGKGSAIFIHCLKGEADNGSSGCIKIPETLMKQLIQSVDGETKIAIYSDISQLTYVD